MNFTKEGVPTHASYLEAWEHKKPAVITKKCKVTGFHGGLHKTKILNEGEEVWAILYVSATRKSYYIVTNDRLERMLVRVPEDTIRVKLQPKLTGR